MVTKEKISPKIVNPRDIAGDTEEEEEEVSAGPSMGYTLHVAGMLILLHSFSLLGEREREGWWRRRMEEERE